MSLRGAYTTASPSASPAQEYAPTLGDGFPHSTLSSPSRIVDRKHREQLSSYKKARWSTLQNVWAAGRRLAGVLEETSDDAGHRTNKRWGYIGIAFGRRKVRRWAMYFFLTALLYCILIKLFSADGTWDEALSAHRAARSHESHLRAKRTSRAPLPRGVMLRASRDHPIEGGLLRVDLNSKVHPVYQLIRDARDAWDDKIDRQSRTLKDAVHEYRRRYGRQPPKGFDKWWMFVVENKVQLPDEYDQINHDLLPFRALSPSDLNRRLDLASRMPDTFTLRIRRGSLRTSVSFGDEIYGANERLEGQADLVKHVAKDLGDLTAVYSVHDSARVVISYGHRRDLLEHVDEEEYFDENEEIDLSDRGWSAVCPAHSHMRNGRRGPNDANFTRSYTFVADHLRSMDICDHPELIPIHGTLLGKNPHVEPLTPLFTLSKTTLHADILGVPVEQYTDILRRIAWEEKYEDKLMWRGSNTGAYYSHDIPWRSTHRARLIEMVNADEGELEMLPPPRSLEGATIAEKRRNVSKEVVNRYYADMAFTGEPIQCDELDGTCRELHNEYRFTSRMSHDAALHYKYIVDVDGNAWSARFQRLLASGSLIFKSTIMPEWWTDRIQPWVHYVPVSVDYSDLYDVLAFFRGDTSGLNGEPGLAREIADAGREWAETYWRRVDMTAYVFRLYLEWARLLAPKRREMDFVYDDLMEIERES